MALRSPSVRRTGHSPSCRKPGDSFRFNDARNSLSRGRVKARGPHSEPRDRSVNLGQVCWKQAETQNVEPHNEQD
ncbi:hypothetical protein AOLI_G00325550 [Acnodon oligacanthus]